MSDRHLCRSVYMRTTLHLLIFYVYWTIKKYRPI
nr:MAG TPA: hypothetical protein [Caudoviricetes sp.]